MIKMLSFEQKVDQNDDPDHGFEHEFDVFWRGMLVFCIGVY